MSRVDDCLECMQTGIRRLAEQVPALPEDDVLLMRLLMLGGMAAGDELEVLLRPYQLGESEFRTLLILFSSPQGSAFPGELCQYATQKPTNMTRITNSLVQRGLVTRMPCREDRRRVVLRITAQGRRLARKLLPMLLAPIQAVLGNFSDHDKRELKRMLHNITVNLGRLADARGETR